jgi:uncharacterized protein
MEIAALGSLLEARYRGPSISARPRSVISDTGNEIIEMVVAYVSDGRNFLLSGDRVNALASYWYASGWADAGVCLGYVSRDPVCPLPCSDSPDAMPGQALFLEAKTQKYDELLSRALSLVEIAPEHGIPAWRGADRTLLLVGVYRDYGRVRHAEGDPAGALSLFCYGHGWLDTTVRCGLLGVLGSRDLFAL